MDILRADIWNIIQKYLADDFNSPETLEKSIQELKQDYPEYYEELKELIQFKESATNFFSDLSLGIVQSIQEKFFEKGYQIGAYKIDDLLSSGNMSDVYIAYRADGDFEQKVAIKVLKENFNSELTKKQFQREKQILANLHHPNIAAIFDGGITDNNRPYIVMEYIEGEPITSYCDKHRFSINERMELFKDVCMAVNYAHQNLVIHKDIKPNNIMVDNNGHVKLMDFGIAQLSEENQNENLLATAYTPNYASPEQQKVESITTASDIYQLGLLLHKLLMGFRYSDIASNTEDIPSNIIFNYHNPENDKDILYSRKLKSVKQLSKKISGDINAIILKSLNKNPKERYPSADAIHQDIENYFNNQPLYAQKTTYHYLFKKFVKRNKKLIQLFSFFIILITTTTTVYFLQIDQARHRAELNAIKAEKEAKRAEFTTNYLINIFKMADPYNNSQKKISVDRILNQSYQELLQSENMDSIMQADILGAMAEVFNNSGYYQKNRDAINKSLSLKQKIYPPLHPKMGISYRQIASSLLRSKSIDSAELYIDKALKIDTIHKQLQSETHLRNVEIQGDIYYYKADYSKALSCFKEIYYQTNDLKSHSQIRSSEILSYIGDTYHQLGKYDSAKMYLTKALKIQRKLSVPNPYMADNYTALATTYLRTEQLDSASFLIERAIELSENIYGEESGELEYPLSIASRIAKKRNRYKESLIYAERALNINKKVFGEHHFYTAQRLNTVGLVHRDFGQPEKAILFFKNSLRIKQRYYPSEIKSIYITKYNYAVCLLSLHKTKEAIHILKDVRSVDREIYSKNHVYSAYTLLQLGRAYLDSDSLQLAFENLTKARRIIESKLDVDHSRRADIYRLFTLYFLKTGDELKARHHAEKALEIYKNGFDKTYWKYKYTSILNDLTYENTSRPKIMRNIEILNSYLHLDNYYKTQLVALYEEIGLPSI